MSLQSALSVAPFFAVSLLVLGCGSSGEPDPAQTSSSGAGASGSTSGSGGSSGTNECNLNTGYDGDEMCILAPDPDEGLQLHYGPSSYDPAEVEPFLLGPGEEIVDCFYVKTSNDIDRFFNEFHIRMRPGTHHLIVSGMNQDVPDGLRACEGGGGFSSLIGGSQTAVRDYPDPTNSPPEDEGLANEMKAHSQVSLQLHFINTTDKPILREAWMNIIYKDPAKVTTLTNTIAHIGGLSLFLPPGQSTTKGGTRAAPADIRIVNLFGHYHAHTVRFSTWKIDAANQKTLVYESYDYHEPGEMNYNSLTQNPPPDASAKTAGGVSGILELKQGEQLQWECEIINTSTATLTFANEVLTGEMCNLFGTYAPSTGSAWISQNP